MTIIENNFEFTAKSWVKVNNLISGCMEWKVKVIVNDLETNVISTIYVHEDNTNNDEINSDFRFELTEEQKNRILKNREYYSKNGIPCNLIAEISK